MVNAAQATTRIVDKDSMTIQEKDVRILQNRRETLQSPCKEFFIMAEITKMTALKEIGVLKEIPREQVPKDAHPVTYMWVYAIKSD